MDSRYDRGSSGGAGHHLLAARNPLYEEVWQQWCTLWLETWSAICAKFGAAEHAETIACFFDSESQLNLVHWRPLIDRACLDEICAGLVCWLKGVTTSEGVWRRHAREAALRSAGTAADADEIRARVVEVLSVLCEPVSTWQNSAHEMAPSGSKRLPLRQGGRATFLECGAVDEVAFLRKMVVKRRVN